MNIVKNDIWEYLKHTDKPIWLYGMGNGADRILSIMEELGIKARGIFASDEFVRHQSFKGFSVCTYSQAKKQTPLMIILMAFGSAREDVRENVLKLMKEQEFYVPDVPVYGQTLFTRSFYDKNRESAEKIFSLFADDKSRLIYEKIINTKLCADIRGLFSCETKKAEEYEEILKINENEIYVDLGAYRGDTVFEFLNFAKGYRKIYAVEPDERAFKKLKENTKELMNIEYINAAIHEKDEKLIMLSNKGRGTSVGDFGKEFIGRSLDSILSHKEATFIKMDVEGHEALAIKGAKETIKKFKPKMKIACYHRSEDLFSIPLQVLEILPDYKLYIRHRRSIPAWDTDFFFM